MSLERSGQNKDVGKNTKPLARGKNADFFRRKHAEKRKGLLMQKGYVEEYQRDNEDLFDAHLSKYLPKLGKEMIADVENDILEGQTTSNLPRISEEEAQSLAQGIMRSMVALKRGEISRLMSARELALLAGVPISVIHEILRTKIPVDVREARAATLQRQGSDETVHNRRFREPFDPEYPKAAEIIYRSRFEGAVSIMLRKYLYHPWIPIPGKTVHIPIGDIELDFIILTRSGSPKALEAHPIRLFPGAGDLEPVEYQLVRLVNKVGGEVKLETITVIEEEKSQGYKLRRETAIAASELHYLPLLFVKSAGDLYDQIFDPKRHKKDPIGLYERDRREDFIKELEWHRRHMIPVDNSNKT